MSNELPRIAASTAIETVSVEWAISAIEQDMHGRLADRESIDAAFTVENEILLIIADCIAQCYFVSRWIRGSSNFEPGPLYSSARYQECVLFIKKYTPLLGDITDNITDKQIAYFDCLLKLAYESGFRDGHDGQPNWSGTPQTDRMVACWNNIKSKFLWSKP